MLAHDADDAPLAQNAPTAAPGKTDQAGSKGEAPSPVIVLLKPSCVGSFW